MAQSHCNLIYHIVFSTRNREPWLDDAIQTRLYEYLGSAIKREGGAALIVNGTADHIHLLVKWRQDKTVADMVRALKANSSGWIHKSFAGKNAFAWQAGYGAFTVSQSQVEKARRYIKNQKKHHKAVSFKDEMVSLLKAHGVEFDERYL